MSVAAEWPRDAAGGLLIAGMPIARAVDMAGGTPCYLYDHARIAERVRALRAALSPTIRLHYAIKANPMPALVAAVARLVDGFDVASAGELALALDAGMGARDIGFAGPGKSAAEIARGHAAGVLFNVESLREARLLGEIGRRTGRPARIAVRCNLPFALKASGMKMTGAPGPFGIDPEDLPAMWDAIGEGGIAFEGFHLYAGSQSLRADAIVEAQERSYDQALAWAAQAPVPPSIITLGGGWGIRYARHDQPLDLAPVLASLNALAARLERDLPGARLVIELGRYLVGEAGLYVARVVDRKRSGGQVFLVTDGGMHQHLAASGNFGQVIRKNYPVAIDAPASDRGEETASVVGPLCTPLDLLADRATLAVAEPGDLFVVFQSGAYGRSASPRGFLSHPDVGEALLFPQPPG